MEFVQIRRVFSVLVLLLTAICLVQPVLAANGSVSISYRGSGGSYIGDTVVFDGTNTVGNITLITITGPGLAPEGVPVYDLNGDPGSGNTVAVNPDGSWKFAWYTSTVKGIEKMQTARYYFTAADLSHHENFGTTSVLMKKPEFYATLTPNPANPGNYISVNGNAERGVSYARIEVMDTAGTVLRTFNSPVSASGYFNYGFHVDMQPGQYSVKVSNPSIKNSLTVLLTIVPPQTPAPVQATPAIQHGAPGTVTPVSVALPAVTSGEPANSSAGAGTLPPILPRSTSSIPLSPLTTIIGLILSGAGALVWCTGRKNQ